MKAEQWTPVLGLEDFYEVSSLGRVRTSAERGHRLISQSVTHGYLKVNLASGAGRKNYRVHRLVLEAFVGPRPEGMMCRHLDGNRQNNRLENLLWGTAAQNQADRVLHGTSNRGTRAPANALSDAQVLEVLADLRPTRAIAADYHVSAETVRRIKAGKAWGWLTGVDSRSGLCRGSRHRHAKLTEAQAIAIRQDTRTYAEIASDYGVNQATVGKIKTGKTWRHLAQ